MFASTEINEKQAGILQIVLLLAPVEDFPSSIFDIISHWKSAKNEMDI